MRACFALSTGDGRALRNSRTDAAQGSTSAQRGAGDQKWHYGCRRPKWPLLATLADRLGRCRRGRKLRFVCAECYWPGADAEPGRAARVILPLPGYPSPGVSSDPSVVKVRRRLLPGHLDVRLVSGSCVFHSRDLVNWRLVGHAIDRPGQPRPREAESRHAGRLGARDYLSQAGRLPAFSSTPAWAAGTISTLPPPIRQDLVRSGLARLRRHRPVAVRR